MGGACIRWGGAWPAVCVAPDFFLLFFFVCFVFKDFFRVWSVRIFKFHVVADVNF